MPRYHIIVDFAIGTYGASEGYITNDVSGTAAAAQVQGLITARLAALPAAWAVTGVTVTNLDLKRSSRFFKPGNYKWPTGSGGTLIIPAFGKFAVTEDDENPIILKAALQIKEAFGTAGREASRYMAGVPQAAAAAPPANLNRLHPVLWWNAVNAFLGLYANGSWAVRARTQTGAFAPQDVVGMALAAPSVGPTILVVANNELPDLKLGERVSLSRVKLKPQFGGSVNGTWRVSVINKALSADTWGIQLEGFPLLDPASFKSFGTLQRFDYTYQTITDAYVEDLTTHDRGGPLPRHRGRRKIRTLLA